MNQQSISRTAYLPLKTEEENLTKIRASLLYTNSETRLFTIFNQYKLINQNLIDMTYSQHDSLSTKISHLISHAADGLAAPNSLDCTNRGCSMRKDIFWVTDPMKARKYAFGKSLTSRRMKSVSCFASQNKLQLLGNLEKVVSSNSTHIKTTNNNIISTACMRQEQHCLSLIHI